ncbi:S7A6O protein, partial [Eudromia elegans]|nr:S7A6O protein [Eudromia elegans]
MERAAVLRVKRKRGGAEPAEALLLACKRRRGEEGGPPGSPRLEKGLFKLVATVCSKDDPVEKYVEEGARRSRAARVARPSAGSAQRIQRELRAAREASRREGRYRVVAGHRPSAAPAAPGAAAQGGGEESADCCGQFQLFDIVQEEEAVEENPQKTSDPDVILCNAVEMIRERLNVSEDSKKAEQHEKEDEYVYDIYYMETSAPGWIQNILSVQPYKEEYELVDEDHIPGEIYEDEDDENDENNWRNDYPDEDEFLAEEDGDGEKESEESLSDEDQYLRRRTWNKYRQEVLQEFGYDEVHDLDSD